MGERVGFGRRASVSRCCIPAVGVRLSVVVGACVLITGINVFGALGPTHAKTAEAAGKRTSARAKMPQAWAWQAQRAGFPSLGDVSGVPAKDLAVAWFGARDKLTYLGIGKRSLKGATLLLKIDEDASNVNVDEAELQGCVILQQWKPAKPMAWDEKPLTDCDRAATASYDESTNAFLLDLTPLAQASSPRTHGVSIEPVEEPKSHFQVVLKGGKAVVVQKPVGDEPDFAPPSGPPATVDDGAGTSTEAAPPSVDFSSSALPPPLDGPPAAESAAGPQSEVQPPQPAIADATPATAEADPATFVWVYAALMGVAVGPLGTRVLAFAHVKKRRR